MCLSVMNRYTKETAYYDYVNGLGLECIYRAAIALEKPEWKKWVRDIYESFFDGDGKIQAYSKEEYSMDQISPGKVFFDMYDETGAPKYKMMLDLFFSQLENQPRTPSGGFWHKKIYPDQMWLDGLYMQGPFYVRYAKRYGDLERCLEDLVFQFELIYRHTQDEKTGLLYHAWDERRKMPWADPDTGRSRSIWGRALGWYCMALVDVLDYVPEGSEYKTRLLSLVSALIGPIIKAQDPLTGLWYQVLDRQGERDNYLESSCSSMFVNFLAKCYRKGYCEVAAREAAEKGYQGLLEYKVYVDRHFPEDYHLIDICKGAGLGQYYAGCPFRDGSYEYYTLREPRMWDNLQGVGPFILAALEMENSERL